MGKTLQRILDKNQRWRERNREKLREYDKAYREAHREEINAKIAAKRKSGEYKKKKAKSDAKYSRRHRKKVRIAIVEVLGGVCVRCGFEDWRALQVDHVDGGGNQARQSAVSMSRYYKEILAAAETGTGEYQLLCANCNQIKQYEEKEWRR